MRLRPASVQFRSGIRLWIFMAACLRGASLHPLRPSRPAGASTSSRASRASLSLPSVSSLRLCAHLLIRHQRQSICNTTPSFAYLLELGITPTPLRPDFLAIDSFRGIKLYWNNWEFCPSSQKVHYLYHFSRICNSKFILEININILHISYILKAQSFSWFR